MWERPKGGEGASSVFGEPLSLTQIGSQDDKMRRPGRVGGRAFGIREANQREEGGRGVCGQARAPKGDVV